MVAAAFVVAILAVLAVTGGRRALRWRVRRRVLALPGRSLERPLVYRRFDEIDAALATARCECGGGLEVLGEGSAAAAGLEGRVVRTACRTCEGEHFLYFRRSEVEELV